eukprot:Em0011g779a
MLAFYGTYTLAAHGIALGFGKRWLHSRQQKGTAAALELPGVSIIKPIVGCDTNLKANLETFFQLSYPKCELLICIAEPDNSPAMSVVRGLVGQYPTITAKVFVGGEIMGVNPKINNMMPAYRQAQYDLIWICDSGIAGTHVDSFPALLDKVYFGTQHLRVYLVANYFGQNCANGMSWLIRRTALEGVGGLANFSDYLAEDFTIGKALWTRRWKLAMSTMPALQNGGDRTLSSYQARMVRWGRLRATMMPWPGLLEPFTECLLLGLLTSVATSHLFGVGVVRFMVFHVGMWLCSDLLLLTIIERLPFNLGNMLM